MDWKTNRTKKAVVSFGNASREKKKKETQGMHSTQSTSVLQETQCDNRNI